MVDVPVEDQHPLDAVRRLRVARRDRALLKKQKPIARARLGVVPGRAHAPRSRSPPRRTAARRPAPTAPPAARTAASQVAGDRDGVQVDLPAAARAQVLDELDVRAGCTASSGSRVASGARTTSQPNQSWRSISASSATIRSGRSGWPGTSWASESSWRSQTVRDTRIPYDLPAMERADLIVVGAGAAGLYAALCAAREGARVALISARPLAETASYWAQGGLAAALADDDSPALHLRTRSRPAAGIVRASAARILTEEAPARFRDLESLGVRFDADRHGNLALGLEGGHSRRRVAHAGGSATGRRILRELSAVVAEHPGIDVLEGRRAGRAARSPTAASPASTPTTAARSRPRRDPRHRRRRRAVVAHHQPAGLVRLRPAARPRRGRRRSPTSSSSSSTPPRSPASPAARASSSPRRVRGEGATLHDADGERFVDELAPRDEVARAIRAMDATGATHVDLDMRHVDPAASPTSSARCARPASTRRASSSPSPPPPTT